MNINLSVSLQPILIVAIHRTKNMMEHPRNASSISNGCPKTPLLARSPLESSQQLLPKKPKMFTVSKHSAGGHSANTSPWYNNVQQRGTVAKKCKWTDGSLLVAATACRVLANPCRLQRCTAFLNWGHPIARHFFYLCEQFPSCIRPLRPFPYVNNVPCLNNPSTPHASNRSRAAQLDPSLRECVTSRTTVDTLHSLPLDLMFTTSSAICNLYTVHDDCMTWRQNIWNLPVVYNAGFSVGLTAEDKSRR